MFLGSCSAGEVKAILDGIEVAASQPVRVLLLVDEPHQVDDIHDPDPVARTVAFLLSDWSKGITAEIIHVDGGYHAIGAELEQPD